jgi:D-galactose 1-dehydrogenase
MIGVGIVGLGHVAAHQAAALEHCDGIRLVAGCDPVSEALARVPEHVRRYERLEDLLGDPDVDAAVIASPNSLHVEHSQLVIGSGKWLVLEKPIAVTRRDAEQLVETRNKSDGRCTVALHAAFGLEVEWLCEQLDVNAFDRQSIVRITSGFYDPYFAHGRLLEHARSLSGSWLDSGINALSVIDRVLADKDLPITDSRMTRVSASGCSEVQGTVDYCFAREGVTGTGLIDTNWTIGRNSKATTLQMQDGTTTIVADHTAQRVVVREGEIERELYRCDNDTPRLTNHYVGVFKDLVRQMRDDRDNFEKSLALHDLVYSAEEWEPRLTAHSS